MKNLDLEQLGAEALNLIAPFTDEVGGLAAAESSKIAFASAVSLSLGYILRSIQYKHKFKTALNNIEQEKVNDEILFNVTIYKKTNEKNPKNGEYFYDQHIVSLKTTDLDKILPNGWELPFKKYIATARELCTDDNPCIITNLHAALPNNIKNKNKMLAAFNKVIVTHASESFNKAGMILVNNAKKRDGDNLESVSYFPILVDEPGAQKRQLRILMIEESMLKDGNIPKEENVRFKITNNANEEVYVHDPNHHQALRVETLNAIIKQYEENKALFHDSKVDIYTGEIIPANDNKYSNMLSVNYASPNNITVQNPTNSYGFY